MGLWDIVENLTGIKREQAKVWAQEKCKDMIAVCLCECGCMAWEHEGMTAACRKCRICREFKTHPRAVTQR